MHKLNTPHITNTKSWTGLVWNLTIKNGKLESLCRYISIVSQSLDASNLVKCWDCYSGARPPSECLVIFRWLCVLIRNGHIFKACRFNVCFLVLFAAPMDFCSASGVRYVYFPEPVTFSLANRTCARLGRGWTMAMPRTADENRCVYDRKVKYELAGERGNVWLGFFRQNTSSYLAVDGKPIGSTYWDSDHPKRAEAQTCALMWGKAPRAREWGDGFCTVGGRDESMPVMCQQSKCVLNSICSSILDFFFFKCKPGFDEYYATESAGNI